jgi:hypothetical protein
LLDNPKTIERLGLLSQPLFIVLWDFHLLWNNIFILNFVTEMINTN